MAQLLLPAILSMTALSVLDALLAAASVDSLLLRRSDSSRELLAQGLANAVSGLFAMLPGSGGMARTQAALASGMRTALGPLLISVFILAITVIFGPLIRLLP